MWHVSTFIQAHRLISVPHLFPHFHLSKRCIFSFSMINGQASFDYYLQSSSFVPIMHLHLTDPILVHFLRDMYTSFPWSSMSLIQKPWLLIMHRISASAQTSKIVRLTLQWQGNLTGTTKLKTGAVHLTLRFDLITSSSDSAISSCFITVACNTWPAKEGVS